MKRLLAIALVLLLLLTASASAYTDSQLRTADALYRLGLFLGTGSTYALDQELTRAQGITLLVRMLGKEKQAQSGTHSHPFGDVDAWADPYVGYAYENKLTDGTSATTFSGSATMTDQMFLTLCLRALGYDDKKASPDFTYKQAREFARKLHLTESDRADASFTRGEAVEVFWTLLNMKKSGSEKTLAQTLIDQKVFTEADWSKAVSIRKNGRTSADGTGETKSAPAKTQEQTPAKQGPQAQAYELPMDVL